MPILLILCYNVTLVTRTAVSLTAVEFKPLAFSRSGYVWIRLVLCCEHIYSHYSVRLLLVACIILSNNRRDMKG
jgi:hypothetical protein